MSVIVIYKCDKCDAEQKTQEEFWTVGVTALPYIGTTNTFVQGKSMQVCRPCLESFGIYVQKKQPHELVIPMPPTLEDLIVDLVQRTVDNI